MSASPTTTAVNLGYLSILQETNGYLGGYLVTNSWGRPLEFRLTTAVQPNRVQQILYATTLQPYICAEVIGKTLVDKTGIPVQLVVTDRQAALDLRLKLEVPVVWLVAADDPQAAELAASAACVRPADAGRGRGPVLCHAQFPQDVEVVREMLTRLDAVLDIAEPFQRIREAIVEARKMGVTGRAA